MATYNNTRAMQEPSMAYIACDHHEAAKAETTKSCRGRKPNNKPTTAQKKKPQRGMGVAKLESLRIQERRKLMTEMHPLDSQHYYSTHMALNEPIPNVPILHGVASHGVTLLGGDGLLGLDPSVMIQRVRKGCGSGHTNPDLRLVQAGSSMSFVETSNELSSIPKIHRAVAPERCDICLKKRFNGHNSGYNGGKDKYAPELSPINSYDITGFNQQNNMINFNRGISSFGARAATSAFYTSHNLNYEGHVEVVAKHRNGNSRDRNLLMEYEFFPGKDSRSTASKEMELPAEASVAVGGEASCFASTAYSANAASNSVDLSLKLSY